MTTNRRPAPRASSKPKVMGPRSGAPAPKSKGPGERSPDGAGVKP